MMLWAAADLWFLRQMPTDDINHNPNSKLPLHHHLLVPITLLGEQ